MRLTDRVCAITSAAILAISALAAAAVPALADSTITVNVMGDGSDVSGGDGACDASPATGDQCTLRAAIQTANASAGQDRIEFSFPGTQPVVINVPTALPQITDAMVIDGYSAANTRQNTRGIGTNAKLRIVLRGPKAGKLDGLHVAAPSTISGLVVQSFGTGIFLAPGSEGSFLLGNFIGTAPTGMARSGNRLNGVHVDCDSAVTIGGATLAARNLIAANGRSGILLCETVTGTVIKGNLIGVGADGAKNLGNEGAGIQGYGTHDVTIGGDLRHLRTSSRSTPPASWHSGATTAAGVRPPRSASSATRSSATRAKVSTSTTTA